MIGHCFPMSPAAPQAPAATRLKGVTVVRPIVFGSVANWLGRKADEAHTHSWHVYVRGLDDDDLSNCISHVVFGLHESFANSKRLVAQPPYEVVETGWGEFDITIEVHFKPESAEAPLCSSHFLKLHPPGNKQPSMRKPVVSERYDELVFVDPTPAFHALLQQPPPPPPSWPISVHFLSFEELPELQALASAQQFVDGEIAGLKDRMLRAEDAAQSLRQEITELEGGGV